LSYDKTEMNAFVQSLYDAKMAESKHGHYETMFHVVHKAIERATPPALPVGELTARKFHEAYERLAPSFGYETRAETKQFDPTSPNGRLMIAVCSELAAAQAAPARVPLPDERLKELANACTPNTETGSLNYECFARAIEADHGITQGGEV
jgi:hypothetical protein